jgi:hypothetical protein
MIYAMYDETSKFYKIGKSADPERRAHQLNAELIGSVETNGEDKKFEDMIQRIYLEFRINPEEAREAGVATSGQTEWYKFSSKEEVEYILSFVQGKHHSLGLSPFSIKWYEEKFKEKCKEPSLRTPSSLNYLWQTRDSDFIEPHYVRLLEVIRIDKKINEPLVITPHSQVLSGNHRLRCALELKFFQVPTVTVCEAWMGSKEMDDLSVIFNNTQHLSCSQPLTVADVQFDMQKLLQNFQNSSQCTVDDAFTYLFQNTTVNALATKYHKSTTSVLKNLNSIKLKIEERALTASGLFKSLADDEVNANLERAKLYHASSSVVARLAEKPIDGLGAVITAMVNDKTTKGVILTHKSYRQRGRSNSKDLVFLADLKAHLGISIQLQEMDQVSLNKKIPNTIELISEKDEEVCYVEY